MFLSTTASSASACGEFLSRGAACFRAAQPGARDFGAFFREADAAGADRGRLRSRDRPAAEPAPATPRVSSGVRDRPRRSPGAGAPRRPVRGRKYRRRLWRRSAVRGSVSFLPRVWPGLRSAPSCFGARCSSIFRIPSSICAMRNATSFCSCSSFFSATISLRTSGKLTACEQPSRPRLISLFCRRRFSWRKAMRVFWRRIFSPISRRPVRMKLTG